MIKQIVIKGAREHNLKGIDLKIPRNKIVVITGLSGSGKSSLAFDTIYAEGQRRYIESLSPYARQFMEKLKKPDVDMITGLAPSISIEQKGFQKNPRSTVGTMTEIYDYLRLLFSKLGDRTCHECGRAVSKQTPDEILNRLVRECSQKEIRLLAPLVRGRKGEYKKLIEDVRKRGFLQMRIDRAWVDVSETPRLSKKHRHDMDVVIDHLRVRSSERKRLLRSIELGLKEGKGSLIAVLSPSEKGRETFFSSTLYCPHCQISLRELAPNHFSFNSPYGACETCKGIGRVSLLKEKEVIRDSSKPILRGAINEDIYFSFNKYVIENLIDKLHERFQFDLATPFRDLPAEVKDAFLWGAEDIEGLMDELKDLYYTSDSETIKTKIRRFLSDEICPACSGGRLKKETQGVKIAEKNITDYSRVSIEELFLIVSRLRFSGSKNVIAQPVLREILERLRFLKEVGLGYLTLERSVATLAGGELQRIKLASQIGVGLTGVLYVLDEPSIGLHPRDNQRLLNTLKTLRDLKNTVIVVEHDAETMRAADYLIDLGPGAGEQGGNLVAHGTPDKFLNTHSLTASYLNGDLKIPVPKIRVLDHERPFLSLKGASAHNLKNISARFPLGLFICVTGVSGSGKSTLVHDTLFKAVHNQLWRTNLSVGKYESLDGVQLIDKALEIDQTPIGRTPRSNPATYTDLFGLIRKVFSDTTEARLRSYSSGRFSFNVKGGRCEACRGEGYQRLEMSFLPDLYVLCDLCRGKRYNEATLEVRFKGKNIADILELSVKEAIQFFSGFAQIRERLQVFEEIGLGYIRLGQSSTTLSGGEAQRIKLAGELSKRATGKTLYILDEPTTGLHFADIQNLLNALLRLRDQGNTILVIEHNLDVIKCADYLIDLGPEGGEAGGFIVGTGTPEEIARNPRSHTGKYLKEVLKI